MNNKLWTADSEIYQLFKYEVFRGKDFCIWLTTNRPQGTLWVLRVLRGTTAKGLFN